MFTFEKKFLSAISCGNTIRAARVAAVEAGRAFPGAGVAYDALDGIGLPFTASEAHLAGFGGAAARAARYKVAAALAAAGVEDSYVRRCAARR